MSTGIFCKRWRLLYRPIQGQLEQVVSLIKTACVLHNFLCSRHDGSYLPPGFADTPVGNGDVVEGEWRREGLEPGMVPAQGRGTNHPQATGRVHELYKTHFSEQGAVAWQDAYILRT